VKFPVQFVALQQVRSPQAIEFNRSDTGKGNVITDDSASRICPINPTPHANISTVQERGPPAQPPMVFMRLSFNHVGRPSALPAAVRMSPTSSKPLWMIANGTLEYVGGGVYAATEPGSTTMASRARATPILINFFT
jgi:hypothetical protein